MSFWRQSYGPLCVFAFILAVLDSLFLDVTFVTVSLLLVALLPWLVQQLEFFKLPGGIELKMRKFESISEQAQEMGLFTEPEPNSAVADPAFVRVWQEDPNLALAGLRIEIEKRLFKLAQHLDKNVPDRLTLGQAFSIIKKSERLDFKYVALLSDLLPSLNAASHGKDIDPRVAEWAITDGRKILAALDEKLASIWER